MGIGNYIILKWLHIFSLRIKFLTACLFLSLAIYGNTSKNKVVRNVLYINSYNTGYDWSDSLVSGVSSVFEQYPDVKLFIEYLDGKRLNSELYFHDFYKLLKTKYKSIKFDVVITSDNDALNFSFLYGDSLYPHIPIAYCGINNPDDYQIENSRYYGILECVNPEKSIKTITRFFPKCENILMITDNTTSGEVDKKLLNEINYKFPNLKFTFIDIIDTSKILKIVKSLKGNDIIYYLGVEVDENGDILDRVAFGSQILNASKVPVFADNETLINKGAVGGSVTSGKTHGIEVAELALKILENPNNIKLPHIKQSQVDVVFNKSVLKDLNISNKQLPLNSKLINVRFNTIFQYLKANIFLIIIVIFLLTVIVFFYINFKNRKNAARTVFRNLEEIQKQNIALEESYGQMNTMNTELELMNIELKETNTKLVEAKNRAEESDKLKSAFLANVSHEIRTPLNSIIGFSNLLEMSNLKDSEKEYLGYIKKGGEVLLHLIEDIIDISKIEVEKLSISKREFSIQQMLTDFFEYYQSYKSFRFQKNVEFQYAPELSDSDIIVFTDEARLRQILINLIDNAFKFTDSGYVKLGYSINGNFCKISVEDSGIGIPSEKFDEVFQSFTKLEHGRSRIYEGTGLGLAIVKKLISLLGGEIWLESELGKGTVFYFTLPLSNATTTNQN